MTPAARGQDHRPVDNGAADDEQASELEPGAERTTRHGAELLLDAQELVVFRDALGASRGTGLDLATVGRDGEVGDA
jgi:hypothetical protein